MTHADAHVNALVRRLVLAEFAPRDGDDASVDSRAIDAQVRYATRVLGSLVVREVALAGFDLAECVFALECFSK